MVALDGLGQQNDLIPEDIEETGPDAKGLRFSFRRRDGEPAGLEGGDERGMIDQDPKASGASGGHDRPNQAVVNDPVRCDDGEMKYF